MKPDDRVDLIVSLVDGVPVRPSEWRDLRDTVLAASNRYSMGHDPLSRSVSDCLAALRFRQVQLSKTDADDAVLDDDLSTRPTTAIPSKTEESREPAEETPENAPAAHTAVEVKAPGLRWTVEERRLYEDVISLFDAGDQAGAMISLERLFMLSPQAQDLEAFLSKNLNLLLKLYRDHLGSLDRVLIVNKDSEPVRIPTAYSSIIMEVLRNLDGHRNLRDLIKELDFSELQILFAVSHLARSGFLELA